MRGDEPEHVKDGGFVFAPDDTDFLGKGVRDASGEKVGTVEGVFVDEVARKVRFLLVAGGGVIGIGDEQRLIPIEAVDHIDVDVVRIRHPRERVAFSPRYSPRHVGAAWFWREVYGWYGFAPAGPG